MEHPVFCSATFFVARLQQTANQIQNSVALWASSLSPSGYIGYEGMGTTGLSEGAMTHDQASYVKLIAQHDPSKRTMSGSSQRM